MQKRDIQQEQTEMLATMLESVDPNNFILPWHKCVSQGNPTNALTKRQYTNGNAMMLWIYQMLAGYETNRWATYKQWFELGGERNANIYRYRMLLFNRSP
jgi:antirestriction protein ArdC